MSDKFRIKKEQVVPLLETKFIKVYDLQYAPGKHYYDATRLRFAKLNRHKNRPGS